MKKTIKLIEAMRSIAGIIAIAAVIGFTFAACGDGGGGNNNNNKTDTVPSAWQGTWNGTGGVSGWTLIFTGTTAKMSDSSGNSCTVGSLVFTAATNTGSNSSTYPNGYTVTGKATATTGDGMDLSVGDNFSLGFFINADGTQIARSTDSAGTYWQKQ